MKKGLMLVVSGPAGSGKGTVNAMLLEREDFAFSVSATTRAPRPGEVDGVNYHYITREEFLSRIDSGDMLEYTEYCGNFYGTPKKEAEEMLRAGKNLILEIEVEGDAKDFICTLNGAGNIKAAELIEDGRIDAFIKDKYASFHEGIGEKILSGKASLEELSAYALEKKVTTNPDSGRQEYLQTIVNQILF